MTEQYDGTVAVLAFDRRPRLGFADIVEEFDIAFQGMGEIKRGLIWDSDDIAMIDRDIARIVLGWLPPDRDAAATHLIIAIGTAPNAHNGQIGRGICERLKARILERCEGFLDAETVLHADACQPVGPDLIDGLCDLLRRGAGMSPDSEGDAASRAVPDPPPIDGPARDPSSPWYSPGERGADDGDARAAQARPDGTGVFEAEFTDLTDGEATLPIRLTIYTLGATLLLHVPPVGASLLVYTALRNVTPVPQTQLHLEFGP